MITLLGENNSGQTPSQGELQQWASQFGINHPVVADTGFGVTFRFVQGYSVGLPSMSLIEAGGEVLYANTWIGESQVQQNLP